MSDREKILASLEPLFQEAERTGKWFYSNYQGLWFSPEQLREHHKNGRFIWGAVNWTLRDPKEKLIELLDHKETIEREIEQFERALLNSKNDDICNKILKQK